jgi:hypothetical protein
LSTGEPGTGVGYFATDQGPQGTLYRCSATDTWTVHYIPYAYPHPLVSGLGAAGYQNNVALGSQPKALPLQGSVPSVTNGQEPEMIQK